MRTLLKILFLLLICFSAKSQAPAPSGFPAPYSAAYYRIGWLQTDSGYIPAYKDTNWIPKFQGTEILWLHAGVDTSKWIRIGSKWIKELKTGDLPNLTATSPIVYNNGNISCPTCGTGAAGILSLNGLTATTQIFTSGTSGSDFNIVSSGAVHTFNFPTGSGSNRGLISTADWSRFDGKQPQLNGTGFVVATGTSISYDNTSYYPNSNPNSFIPLTAISALSPALYNNTTGVVSVDTTTGNTHLATQAYVLNHQSSGTITGAGNLSPLFTTSIVSNTIVFTLSNAAANSILGNNTSGAAQPTYFVPTSATLNGWFGGAGIQPQINGTGFVKATGTTISYDNSTYLTTAVLTASNGLTATGTNVVLGGNLTQTTSVRGVFGIPKLLTFDTLSTFQARALTLGDTTKLVLLLDSSTKKSELSVSNARASGYFRGNMVTTNDAGISANVGKVGSTLYGSPLFQALSSDSSISFRASRIYLDLDTTLTSVNSGLYAKGLPYTLSTSGYAQVIWNQTTGKFGTTAIGAGGGGSGTVTSFSAGTLSPLFTTSVATATTTPALTFTLSNAAANSILGNNTGGSAAPTYFVPTSTTLNNWFGGTIQGALTLTTTGTSGASTLIGNTLNIPQYTSGGGTVTSFSAGNLSPLFTSNVSNPTTTPSHTFTLNTQNAGTVFIGDSVSNGIAPSFRRLVNKDVPTFSTWPAQTPLNVLLYKDYFTANDLSSIQVNASGGTNSSVSIINGTMSTTASSPAYSNYNFFYPYYFTMLNHIQVLQEFKDSIGGSGYATVLRDPSVGLVGYLSGNAGASTINLLTQTGTSYASAAGPTIVIGHSYRTILTINDSTISFSAQDLTTSGSTSTVTFNYVVASNQSPRIANIGFFAFSGTYNVTKFQVSSTDTRNANLVFVGDSKTREYTPNAWNNRYAVQVGANYPNYVIYAGTSMKITDILALKGELLSLNGQTVLLNIGSNDVRNTGFTSLVQSNYIQLVNLLTASGAKVLHTVLPEDSTAGGVGLTAFKNFVSGTYGSNYIDCWTGMTTSGDNKLKASMNAGDGIHPNQTGHNFIATTLNASGLFTTLDPSRRAPYRINDGIVKFEGDSLFLAFQIFKKYGYVSRWNTDGNLSWGVLQDNGSTSGASSSALVPMNGAVFTVGGQLGLQGLAGGTLYGDRSSGAGSATAVYGQYVLSNLFRTYNNTTTKDLNKTDSIGRMIFNVAKTTSSAAPSAYIDFIASDGTAGNAPIKIRAGTLLATPENGSVEADASHIYFTAGGTRFQLDQQAGSLTVGTFSNTATANGLDITTGVLTAHAANGSNAGMLKGSGSQTIAPILTMPAPLFSGTTSAGANDSIMTIDPATGQTHWRNGIFTLKVANGLTASSGGDSLFWGGTLIQNTTISGGNFSVALGTSGSKLSNLSIWSTAGVNLTGGQYASSGGSQLLEVASTINNPVTAGSGNVTNFSAYFFQAPTVTSTNSSVTYASPATFRIENSPTMSTNSTATGVAYALDVAAGISHFGVGASNISALFDGVVAMNGVAGNTTVGLGLGASIAGRATLNIGVGVDPSSGTINTTSANMWYNGTNLYFVDGSGTGVARDLLAGVKNYTHSIFTPATGGTVNLVVNKYNIVNPSGTLATLTVNLPSSPNNNDVVYIKYTQSVTAVTYANGTVVDGITAPTLGSLVVLTYDAGTTSWY